jgi:hypothetical protein
MGNGYLLSSSSGRATFLHGTGCEATAAPPRPPVMGTTHFFVKDAAGALQSVRDQLIFTENQKSSRPVEELP